MARTRKARKPAAASIEPGAISQEVPDEKPEGGLETSSESGGNGPNKSEAARKAIVAGYEKPVDAVAYIKRTFGIDMNPQHFSAIKSNYKKKHAGAKAGAPRKRAPLVEGYLAPPPAQSSGGQPDLIESLETLKPMIASLGADTVKRLVDLLG
jgi:hypothetical protein